MPIKPVIFDEKDLKKIFKTDNLQARIWRQLRRAFKSIVLFLVIFTVLFYGLNWPAFFKRASFMTDRTLIIQAPVTPQPAVNYEPTIIIPKIGVQAPVFYDVSYETIIEQLRNGVVRYEGTADLGQIGNVVLLGHSSDYLWSTGQYKTVFALLDKLTINDEIILPRGNNRYVYRVTQTKIFKPTELDVLQRTATPTLTLISCYPVGTTLRRIIVIAALAEGPLGSIQTTEPYLGEKLTTAR